MFAALLLTLALDASGVSRGIVHATLTMPVNSGPLTLAYPEWIPGTHSPIGRVENLVSLRFHVNDANGAGIAWQRDLDDPYLFHLQIPPGTKTLAASYDYVFGVRNDSTTSALAVLEWWEVVLYPQGARVSDLQVAPSLRVPAGWRYGTALAVARANGTNLTFGPVSLERLADSPVAMGAHARRWVLSQNPPSEIDAFADSEAALAMAPQQLSAYKYLVREGDALFRSRHWRNYHFLYALSEPVAHGGLEHHESSNNRSFENSLTDREQFALAAGLLPHEFVHSWNGKYRRPAGLATANFNVPIKDDLLWVYEGLTTYYGDVLTFRSGLRSLADLPDYWAQEAASLDVEPGRKTRPLIDTAVIVASGRSQSRAWSSQNRRGDYYPEAAVIWNEADQLIRTRTHGARSLDDFARTFFGGADTTPRVVPYTRADVVRALNAVLPYDWAGFFTARIDAVTPHLPSGSLDLAGRRLTYTSSEPKFLQYRERVRKTFDARYSLGLIADSTGNVVEVLDGSPAARAGLGPQMQVLAINDRRFDFARAHAAIARTGRGEPVSLIVRDGDYVRTLTLDYRGGERYPHLVPIPGRRDHLLDPFRPLTRHAT